MKIAILQTSTLAMSDSKVDYFARIASKQDAKLMLFGEYVMNSFFKELENMPENMIKEQTNHKIHMLGELSKKYDISFIAPIIRPYKTAWKKSILKAQNGTLRYFDQQIYMNYSHWNEEKFFISENADFKLNTFSQDGFKFALITGFEIHFDEVFRQIDAKKIDVLLLPSVCTFDSALRWEALISSRAFTHNIYILKANRIGSYAPQNQPSWDFYGESALYDPYGQCVQRLDLEEALLIANIEKSTISNAKKLWNFHKIRAKKNFI